MSSADRDSGLQPFTAVEAGVQDYVDLVVGGHAIQVVFESGRTVYATRGYESDVYAVCEGSGGGYCWDHDWPRSELTTWLRKAVAHEPRIRRGPADEVFPEGYR